MLKFMLDTNICIFTIKNKPVHVRELFNFFFPLFFYFFLFFLIIFMAEKNKKEIKQFWVFL